MRAIVSSPRRAMSMCNLSGLSSDGIVSNADESVNNVDASLLRIRQCTITTAYSLIIEKSNL